MDKIKKKINVGEFEFNKNELDDDGNFIGDNNNLKFENENENEVEVIVIKPNIIKDKDWSSENYLDDLFNNNFVEYHTLNLNNFINDISKLLEITKYDTVEVKTSLYLEEKEHNYEMMYIDFYDHQKKDDLVNELALMIKNNGDEKIYGNVILIKNHLPLNNFKSISMVNFNKNHIITLLNERVNTNIILYDNGDWYDKKVMGSLDNFAEEFFEDEDKYKIQKLELGFLKHNINIWYTKFEYGEEGVCGKLLKNLRINKCIVFCQIGNDIRGNIYLDEFDKIKFLSNKLENYNTPEKYTDEEKDNLGRLIIKNRYRVLNDMYKNNLK